jgi:hypothetical protein
VGLRETRAVGGIDDRAVDRGMRADRRGPVGAGLGIREIADRRLDRRARRGRPRDALRLGDQPYGLGLQRRPQLLECPQIVVVERRDPGAGVGDELDEALGPERGQGRRTVCRDTSCARAISSSRSGAPGASAPLRISPRSASATRTSAVGRGASRRRGDTGAPETGGGGDQGEPDSDDDEPCHRDGGELLVQTTRPSTVAASGSASVRVDTVAGLRPRRPAPNRR